MVAGLLLLAGQGPALADTVSNTVAASGGDTITAGGSTTVGYSIRNTNSQNSGDPQNSCNAADGSPATLTVLAPADVTVSPASQTFSDCTTVRYFGFSSTKPGSYPISVGVADSGAGTYTTAGATFTLTVEPPVVTNTAPVVTLTGVTDLASYEFGSVPQGTCEVTDEEDGHRSFAATSGPVTGDRAADGLGGQTQSCSYTDQGGLTGTASATYTIVDSTGPSVSVAAPPPVEAIGRLTPVTFSVAATDAVDGPREATCATADGAPYAPGDSFPVGATTLTCSAVDAAGNTGTSSAFDVLVTDTTPPTVSTSANKVVGNESGAGAVVTYDAPTATDLVDGGLSASCLPASGSQFALGTTTVSCSATDTAGNTGTEEFTVEVQDRTDPLVSVPADLTVEATSADGATVGWDAVTATDDVDGPLRASCDAAPGSVFAIGVTTVTCSATDAAGNTGDSSFTVTVADTTAPDVAVPDDIVEEATSAAGADVRFAVRADDVVDGSVPATCDPASGSGFGLGETMVVCTATDHAGNTGSAGFTVTVRDTRPPVVEVPDDVTAEATGPDGATVGYDGATAADVVDGTVTPVCEPGSGTTFALGTTTVTCRATDAAGNTGASSFTVTVEDTVAPDVRVPANLAVGNDLGRDGASEVTWGTVLASDVVSGELTARCAPGSGSAFPMGPSTVTCSVTDAAGNTGTGTFTVEVQDRNKPVVTVPADVVVEATSAAGAEATWTGVAAEDDVDGPLPVTCDADSGSVFPVGDTTVTCSATDAAGNEGGNAFTVTVEDTTAPTVTVAADGTATATSAAGAVVSYDAPTADDLVDGAVAASCDKESGSVFALGTTTVTCTAEDRAGNQGTGSFTVTVTVAWSGVLAPVDGRSAFRLGSTIPVKFALTGDSAGVTDLVARLYFRRVGAATSLESEAVSTAKATTGNLFRYDAGSGQYVFNLGTKSLGAGSYTLRIDLGDGVQHTVGITLS